MFTSINPATGMPGQSYPALTPAAIEARIAFATHCYAEWRHSDLAERSACLERIARQFEDNIVDLAEIATREMGKTRKSAIAEVEKCVAGFRYYAEHGPAMLAMYR